MRYMLVATKDFQCPYGVFKEKRAIEKHFIRKPPKATVKDWIEHGLVVRVPVNQDDNEKPYDDDSEFTLDTPVTQDELALTDGEREFAQKLAEEQEAKKNKQKPQPKEPELSLALPRSMQ